MCRAVVHNDRFNTLGIIRCAKGNCRVTVARSYLPPHWCPIYGGMSYTCEERSCQERLERGNDDA